MNKTSSTDNSQTMTPAKTMVTSFEIDVALHSRLKVYAAKNRLKIKDVVNEALRNYINDKDV